MSGPLDISLNDKRLFIESLLIPAFDPDNKLNTPEKSKKRKEWLQTRGVEKEWSLNILAELIERYGTIKSLEEAERKLVEVERLLEKAEDNERKQGFGQQFCFHAKIIHKRQSIMKYGLHGLSDLVAAIHVKWPGFRIMEFGLFLIRGAGSMKTEVEITDETLLLNHRDEELAFTIRSRCMGFSDYANKKAEAMHATGAVFTDPALIPTNDAVFPIFPAEGIDNVAKAVQAELSLRARATDLEQATEYTKREFISPLLVAAICVCNHTEKLISMLCEKTVVGKRGRGPIDYALLFQGIFVLLTEAKNMDLEGGQAQNLVQQEASRESLANAFVPLNNVGTTRKRKYDEVYEIIRIIPSFGIVTTAEKWRFTKLDHSLSKAVVTKSSTFPLLLDPKGDATAEKEQLKNIVDILVRIIGILHYQMDQVGSHAAVNSLLGQMDPTSVNAAETAFCRLAEQMDREDEQEGEEEA